MGEQRRSKILFALATTLGALYKDVVQAVQESVRLPRLSASRCVVSGMVATSAVLLPISAAADVIVDTGVGPSVWSGYGLNASRGLAAEFNVGTAAMISSVELWMSSNVISGSSNYTAAIYTDGGDIPGSDLFSAEFIVSGRTVDWHGATGLSWNLAAGSYWAVFEVRNGQTGSAVVPHPSISPLGNEANKLASSWHGNDALSLGVRILGEVRSVPEPGTLVLLALCLAGLAVAPRRR
jgi:hypothetical protein